MGNPPGFERVETLESLNDLQLKSDLRTKDLDKGESRVVQSEEWSWAVFHIKKTLFRERGESKMKPGISGSSRLTFLVGFVWTLNSNFCRVPETHQNCQQNRGNWQVWIHPNRHSCTPWGFLSSSIEIILIIGCPWSTPCSWVSTVYHLMIMTCSCNQPCSVSLFCRFFLLRSILTLT